MGETFKWKFDKVLTFVGENLRLLKEFCQSKRVEVEQTKSSALMTFVPKRKFADLIGEALSERNHYKQKNKRLKTEKKNLERRVKELLEKLEEVCSRFCLNNIEYNR